MSRLDDMRIDYQNRRANGESISWDSHVAEAQRQEAQFTPPAEGEMLEYGWSQLPTAAPKLRAIGARTTSHKRTVIGQHRAGYFEPEVIFLFDHLAPHGQQLRVIDPDGAPHTGTYAAYFTETDVALMVAEAARYSWPGPKTFPIGELDRVLAEAGGWIGEAMREAHADGRLFTATTPDGMVQLLQMRRDPATEGDHSTSARKYISVHPTTSKAGFLCGEPEGPLAFSCGQKLKDATGKVAFIHEGSSTPHRIYAEIAKVNAGLPSALLDSHPLRDQLIAGVHVGYLGGAGWPQRADWSAIRNCGADRVVLVPDNDDVGRGAVRKISRLLAGMTNVSWLQLSDDFTPGMDLSDPWPSKFFKEDQNGGRSYRIDAPRYENLERPASWLTREIPPPAGQRGPRRPSYALIPGTADNWIFAEELERYYDLDRPRKPGLKKETLNRVLRRFCDTPEIAGLIDVAAGKSVSTLTYRPDVSGGVITEDGTPKFNQYSPPSFVPAPPGADVSMWVRFMEHLIPEEEDREHVFDWIATLYARPDIHIYYGILLQSAMTGTGKSTLATIASKLVGLHNTSFPSAAMLTNENFNGWQVNVRLVAVHEIYEGSSWKAANILKAKIGQDDIEVNLKNINAYSIKNWAHFIAASNNPLSLRMEGPDRRWLVPRITEEKLVFNFELYRWLDGPGIPAIARWCLDRVAAGKSIPEGTEAPMTERKRQQIEASTNEAQHMAIEIAEAIVASDRPCVIGAAELLKYIKDTLEPLGVPVKETAQQVAQAVSQVPGIKIGDRMRHGGGVPSASIRNVAFCDLEKSDVLGDKKHGQMRPYLFTPKAAPDEEQERMRPHIVKLDPAM